MTQQVPTPEQMREAAMMPGRAQEFGEWWKAHALRLEAENERFRAALERIANHEEAQFRSDIAGAMAATARLALDGK